MSNTDDSFYTKQEMSGQEAGMPSAAPKYELSTHHPPQGTTQAHVIPVYYPQHQQARSHSAVIVVSVFFLFFHSRILCCGGLTLGRQHHAYIIKGIWQQKLFLAHLKELLKSFIKLFYSFYISRLVFEILRLEERKKSVKSAILDIHGYARFTSQQGSRDFFFFNQTLL